MKETRAILSATQRSRLAGEPCVLATIVRTEGSTYRKAGARMLVTIDRRTCGTVSGGCLEAHVAREAFALTEKSPTARLALATTQDDDLLRSGAGCHGIVHLLLERINPPATHPVLDAIADCRENRCDDVLAIIAGTSLPGLSPGQTITATQLPAEMAELRCDAAKTHSAMQPFWKKYQARTGWLEVLIQPIAPPPRLLLCGTGDDAIPVARIAAELAWEILVLDTGTKGARADRFAGAKILTAPPAAVAAHADPFTAAVLMTHRFLDDLELLRHLLPLQLPYIGVLGPRGRTQRLLAELSADTPIPVEQLAPLRSPIGLDIGSETPEQIALAIVAEIQAVLADRNGRALTQKTGPLQIPAPGGVPSCTR